MVIPAPGDTLPHSQSGTFSNDASILCAYIFFSFTPPSLSPIHTQSCRLPVEDKRWPRSPYLAGVLIVLNERAPPQVHAVRPRHLAFTRPQFTVSSTSSLAQRDYVTRDQRLPNTNKSRGRHRSGSAPSPHADNETNDRELKRMIGQESVRVLREKEKK